MNDELKNIIKRVEHLNKKQVNGNEEKWQKISNDIMSHISEFKKIFFTDPSCEENEIVSDSTVDTVETIASDYYELTKFVLKRMKVKKFNEIQFVLNKDLDIEISIIKDGKEIILDFDCYVHHNDLQETEYRIEIESLFSDDLDWNRVIDLLRNKDWSMYRS